MYMTIQEIIDTANYSELQQLSLKGNNEAIVSFMNLGIIELHKRFALDTSEVLIELGVDGDVDNPYTMISATEYQLPSDIMHVIASYEEDGSNIPFNDETNPYSIYTTAWNKIQVPLLGDNTSISIIYKPNPTTYTINDLANSIALPIQLIDPLLMYIGYKAHASVTNNTTAESESNILYNRFEAACKRVEDLGLLPTDSYNSSVEDKGFM